MLYSIRWRLVTSYVLLTLLAVTLVGVLALSLVERYVTEQERRDLTANAEAVAEQARQLMWPAPQVVGLDALARAASFLGGARVRILDAEGQVLADSGPRDRGDELLWAVPPEDFALSMAVTDHQALLLALEPGFHAQIIEEDARAHMLSGLPSGTELTLIRRFDGLWGSRLMFEEMQPSGGVVAAGEATASPEAARPAPAAHQVSIPISNGVQEFGSVELSRVSGSASEAIATTRRAFSLAAAGATLMAALVGLVVSDGLTAPLSRLAQAAARMSRGDFSARAPSEGKGEIAQVADQFNQMAARLEASFRELAAERDALRRFIADASHELRTPITALKTFNELLQSAAAHDTDARTEFLAESERQITRMQWITHNLLDLSRLDAGLTALEVAPHDAGDLVERVAGTFQPLARERGISLIVQGPEAPVIISCDRPRIESALSNLLDNALKFTEAGGRVRAGVMTTGSGARFWVEDTGPGVEVADQHRLFDRFYRGSNSAEGGTGLGLAIVKSIVQAHGGQVSIESVGGSGSRFSFDLPLYPPTPVTAPTRAATG